MLKIDTFGLYYCNVYVSIKPFSNIKDVLGLFPFTYNRSFSANFNIKEGTHNNIIRWGGILGELMKVAKFHKTLLSNPSIFKDYKIVIENKFLMGILKYEICLDTNFHDNGFKGKITIKTGQPSNSNGSTYLACESDIENLIKRMYYDIGLSETKKYCEEYSKYADLTNF